MSEPTNGTPVIPEPLPQAHVRVDLLADGRINVSFPTNTAPEFFVQAAKALLDARQQVLVQAASRVIVPPGVLR